MGTTFPRQNETSHSHLPSSRQDARVSAAPCETPRYAVVRELGSVRRGAARPDTLIAQPSPAPRAREADMKAGIARVRRDAGRRIPSAIPPVTPADERRG